MLRKMGSCNNCGQCCGCETAPNRISPFPATWPEAVRNWTIASIEENAPIFKITGHPSLGAARQGTIKVGSFTIRWIWVVGAGLNKNLAPWGDESTYEPECPALMPGVAGVYPCALEGTQWEIIRTSLGCREIGMPEYLDEGSWDGWITDHPLCSLDYQAE